MKTHFQKATVCFSKKKELIGNFKNAGAKWDPEPVKVNDHDFRSQADGIAVPYGVYDLQANRGTLFVGTSFDTPGFAVDCVEKWWRTEGRHHYPRGRHLVILADGGGSNAANSRAFKFGLQHRLCNLHGLTVEVLHYPPGTSKWNPIEHRLFPHVTRAWCGVVFRTLEIVTACLRRVWTSTGLKITYAVLDKVYPLKRQASDRFLERFPIQFEDPLPDWNYTVVPTAY
jgi:hypothetical protein